MNNTAISWRFCHRRGSCFSAIIAITNCPRGQLTSNMGNAIAIGKRRPLCALL